MFFSYSIIGYTKTSEIIRYPKLFKAKENKLSKNNAK